MQLETKDSVSDAPTVNMVEPEMGHVKGHGAAQSELDVIMTWAGSMCLRIPCTLLVLFFVLMLLFAAKAAPHMSNFAENGRYDWTVSEDNTSLTQDAVNDAFASTDELSGSSSRVEERSKFSSEHTVLVYYEIDDKSKYSSVFHPKLLREMCEVERIIVQHTTYPQFCKLKGDESCEPPSLSIVNLFYGAGHNYSCSLLDTTAVKAVSDSLTEMLWTEAGRRAYGLMVADSFFSANSTRITASLISLRRQSYRPSPSRRT